MIWIDSFAPRMIFYDPRQLGTISLNDYLQVSVVKRQNNPTQVNLLLQKLAECNKVGTTFKLLQPSPILVVIKLLDIFTFHIVDYFCEHSIL